MIVALLAAVGFGASAGLNAYLPLLILALADRFTGIVDLSGPWDMLSSGPGIVLLLLLLPAELMLDKIAGLDAKNDRIHQVIRPLAGGLAGGAIGAAEDSALSTVAGVIVGAACAIVFCRMKIVGRRQVSTATSGLANPFVSLVEDAIVVPNAVLAAFFPWALVLTVPASFFGLRRMLRKLAGGGGIFARLNASRSRHVASSRLK